MLIFCTFRTFHRCPSPTHFFLYFVFLNETPDHEFWLNLIPRLWWLSRPLMPWGQLVMYSEEYIGTFIYYLYLVDSLRCKLHGFVLINQDKCLKCITGFVHLRQDQKSVNIIKRRQLYTGKYRKLYKFCLFSCLCIEKKCFKVTICYQYFSWTV